MKSTAIAHSNIAFIKYWGRDNPNINIPPNDSLSLTKEGLDGSKLETKTTIEFSPKYEEDTGRLDGKGICGRDLERIILVVNPLRKLAKVDYNFKFESVNDFPTAAGLASSAAGFAALAVAAADALGLKLTPRQLSTYARLGSGSAARSIEGGVVHWHKGFDHETSYAEQICGHKDIDLNAVIAVVSSQRKKVTSDEGHGLANTSPYNRVRIEQTNEDLPKILAAVKNNNFNVIGETAEASAMYMHTVMMTSHPRQFYWTPDTYRVITEVYAARMSGELNCYFSVDAGPNVHVFCRPDDTEKVREFLKGIEGVKTTIPVQPGKDARITNDHLF